VQIPHLSKRFSLKRFLGLTQEEITENERLWREENAGLLKPPTDAASELRSAGVTPGGIAADAADQTAEAPADMAAAAEEGSAEGAAPAETPAA
jgi:hypothetical protein